MRSLILIGFPRAGKTTAGQKLAKALGLPLLDTDREIERQHGAPVREIFVRWGEAHFRDLEEKVILALHPTTATIIATGGGAVLRETVATHLATLGPLIYLEIAKKELRERLERPPRPPFLSSDAAFDRFYALRHPLYAKLATYRVHSWEAIVSEICCASQPGESPTAKPSAS